jgi:multiple sugar transport system substrate-binding protein
VGNDPTKDLFGDSVGKSYSSFSDLNTGLSAWEQQLVSYGNQQGFTVTGQ